MLNKSILILLSIFLFAGMAYAKQKEFFPSSGHRDVQEQFYKGCIRDCESGPKERLHLCRSTCDFKYNMF